MIKMDKLKFEKKKRRRKQGTILPVADIQPIPEVKEILTSM